MPLTARIHRLPALALAGCAALTFGVGSAAAAVVPASQRHHHHHVTLASSHHHARGRRAEPAKHHAKKTTTAPTAPSTPSTPVTTATTPVTMTPVAAPVTPAPTLSATTTTTTTSTPDDGQILFQNSYPSSGNALNIANTGWTAAQYPSDSGVREPTRIEFGPPPGSPSDPNLPTTNVAQFTLQPFSLTPGASDGDVTNTGGDLANRVEVYGRYGGVLPAASWPDPVGSIRWYSFSVYIPSDFPTSTSSSQWFDFTQWKGLNTGSPPVAMEIRGTNFVLGGANSNQTLGSIDPGTWTHFVVGLDFSDSATTGWATAYVNGTLVVNQVPTQTMNTWTVSGTTSADPDYLKMGIYRSETWHVTQDLYLTPMTIGTTLASVS